MLGAIYGGRKAADTAFIELGRYVSSAGEDAAKPPESRARDKPEQAFTAGAQKEDRAFTWLTESEAPLESLLEEALVESLGVLRNGSQLRQALESVERLPKTGVSDEFRVRRILAEAVIKCALWRGESRGAHTRLDYPESDEACRRTTAAVFEDGQIQISYIDIPELRQ